MGLNLLDSFPLPFMLSPSIFTISHLTEKQKKEEMEKWPFSHSFFLSRRAGMLDLLQGGN